MKSYIQAVRYQIVSYSRWSIYFFHCTRTQLSAIPINPVFWYFQIFSGTCYDWILSIGYHVSFADLGATLGLSTFCTIFPTFFRTSISPDFTWIFIDWVSAGFFPGVFSAWPEKKKRPGKKPVKNVPPNSVKISVRPYSLSREDAIFANPITPSENRMICINSCLWQIFPSGSFFWEKIFQIWYLTSFSFMIIVVIQMRLLG